MEQLAMQMRELTVAEILDRWPQTISVFLGRRMACVGCAVAPFETPVDVARIYRVDLTPFLHELCQAGPSREATF